MENMSTMDGRYNGITSFGHYKGMEASTQRGWGDSIWKKTRLMIRRNSGTYVIYRDQYDDRGCYAGNADSWNERGHTRG